MVCALASSGTDTAFQPNSHSMVALFDASQFMLDDGVVVDSRVSAASQDSILFNENNTAIEMKCGAFILLKCFLFKYVVLLYRTAPTIGQIVALSRGHFVFSMVSSIALVPFPTGRQAPPV